LNSHLLKKNNNYQNTEIKHLGTINYQNTDIKHLGTMNTEINQLDTLKQFDKKIDESKSSILSLNRDKINKIPIDKSTTQFVKESTYISDSNFNSYSCKN